MANDNRSRRFDFVGIPELSRSSSVKYRFVNILWNHIVDSINGNVRFDHMNIIAEWDFFPIQSEYNHDQRQPLHSAVHRTR